MDAPEVLYSRVYNTLMKYNRQLQSINNDIATADQIYRDGCISTDNAMQVQLRENAETETRLRAFIEIARAHASRLIETGQEYPIDRGTLSRLSVQISNASRDDPYAEQLFTQATGQLATCIRASEQIQARCEDAKRLLSQQASQKKKDCEQQRSELNIIISTYFQSEEFQTFVAAIHGNFSMFGSENRDNSKSGVPYFISIGTKQVQFPVPFGFDSLAVRSTYNLYDQSTSQIGIPMSIDLSSGSGTIVDYQNETENILLSGLQNFLLNIACYCGNSFEQIVFIDPIRFNRSSLGIMQPLATGNNSFIDSVPLSLDEVRKKLASIIANLNDEERKIVVQKDMLLPKRILIFHNFPQAYDSSMISQIQQIFVNAAHYNITAIATHNISSKNAISSDSLSYIRTIANIIVACNGCEFSVTDICGNVPFHWYNAPQKLPDIIRRKYVDEKAVVDTSNNYERRLGFNMQSKYRKGVRHLTNIPYGIDAQGNILTLDFENSNFATFICGATRSGKSTLLHTLITGIIKSTHPDDVEIWLIDFKMTEFSRYISHRPPHVRYIILDESPELVYDIINRLTEILIKRQNIFKGKWLKLDKVPPEKYMPAIFVIIDEFSVMSQIIADSITNSKENYSSKLRTLLAKGAAMGLHFIFASQGFESDTRGLTAFSKNQIQQRIAMKTEYNEIKATLDLKSTSDDDKAMMEQLPVHHALVRIPVDDRGNHLQLTHVLYIPDYTKQEEMIDTIWQLVTPAPRYNALDTSVFIDKKAMVVDGNSFTTFISRRGEMDDYVQKHSDTLYNGDEVVLFLGEPRRMMPLYPIEVANGFCENILMVAPLSEKMPATSVLMSIAASLEMQGKRIDVWTTSKNTIYRQMVIESQQRVQSLSRDIDEVCNSIRHIKDRVQAKTDGNEFIVLLGIESLLIDMSYQEGAESASAVINTGIPAGGMSIEKRAPGEMDLNSRLNAMIGGISDSPKTTVKVASEPIKKALQNSGIKVDGAYDARNDLKFILTQGPRLGYHFVLVFNTVGELNQSKWDLSLFKHKILFRLAKTDATSVIGSSGAGIISELDDHSFRYTNGLDALSFRPYLHQGLSWDGWQMSGNLATNAVEEDEYLM